MARIVHDHHPEAENYSPKYSSATREEVSERATTLDDPTKLLDYPFDLPVYVLYAADTEIETAHDIDFDREWLGQRIAPLPRAEQVVAFRLVELLEAAVDVRTEDEFRLYKAFEPEKIQQALSHVSWGHPLPQVAGEVMSNLILRHSLPNANHRTGIAMLQFCIESVAPDFEMPRTHIDDSAWREWVDPYIVTSKQLITVRRNNVRFRRLAELGVDGLSEKMASRFSSRISTWICTGATHSRSVLSDMKYTAPSSRKQSPLRQEGTTSFNRTGHQKQYSSNTSRQASSLGASRTYLTSHGAPRPPDRPLGRARFARYRVLQRGSLQSLPGSYVRGAGRAV